jgi:dihydrofolate reductase
VPLRVIKISNQKMTEKKISIIVAIADNYAIGKDNQLLWHLSGDLKRFKQLTSGHTIVMGKNTFFSLPIRPLPNRTSVVITDVAGEIIEGCTMAYSIDEAIEKMESEKENFIIGGGSIYKQFLPFAQKLYLTRVHKDFEADCFFPEINFSEWKLMSEEKSITDEKTGLLFSYQIFERK